MSNLVIVESPVKARTLQRFLGDKYQIEASMGHVRDLPKSELGVDVDNNFEPRYIIPRDKRKRVNELKKMAKNISTLWLATDLDREGEAIAWHLEQLLSDSQQTALKDKQITAKDKKKKIEIKRVVFHEITENAIKEAFENPKEIDIKLVDAQQARRILDRLVGYKLSPLLWEKVKKGLSAGRVQSVALRLIVEREKEVLAFKPEEYWVIEVELQVNVENKKSKFVATVIKQNGKNLEIKNKKAADEHVNNLEKAKYLVSKVTQKEVRRFPYPPFTTSTLQQTAANRLGYSPRKTMMLSQALYERGFITYMRTDSVNLSTQAITAVRAYINESIGKVYLPNIPRIFKSKSRNAQEAHEAIRPTSVNMQLLDISKQSSSKKRKFSLNKDHVRLYDLIWKRFVACQMKEAVMDQTSVDVTATVAEEKKQQIKDYLLRATGSVMKFDGWLKLYGKDAEKDKDKVKQILPKMPENQHLNLIKLLPGQHFTEFPPRYTEASLIKELEKLGIGRPSTYAPVLSTIQERFYVEMKEKKFVPTVLGMTVTDFLMEYFADILDYAFTARMEDELDEIARGEREWKPIIKTFYEPFEKKLEQTKKIAKKVKIEVQFAGKKCPECGKELVIKIGRFGKFLACSGFPECKHTESLEEKINVKCSLDGGDIVIRHTRRRKTFYGCKNWPGCKFASWTKPKSAAAPKTSS
ncbi:type I DNA topoisomerase [Patescibacteria group bacterium]|nr:type I DNA topoisomerase [Patescibacteria group bacterium]